ncbi:MAG TPA: hypothetical protein VFF19_14595 [Reyranella sp.]|jgi:hypothetical protein|nr:hypothetical protein [Reyranella sp.]
MNPNSSGIESKPVFPIAHAWTRPGRAWIEQCWGVAVLAAAVPQNWLATGDHLIRNQHRTTASSARRVPALAE